MHLDHAHIEVGLGVVLVIRRRRLAELVEALGGLRARRPVAAAAAAVVVRVDPAPARGPRLRAAPAAAAVPWPPGCRAAASPSRRHVVVVVSCAVAQLFPLAP
jgi:hypothetical protein